MGLALLQSPPADAQVLMLLGCLDSQAGDLWAALAWFEEALRVNPHDPALYANLGQTFGQLSNWEGASRCFETLCELRPHDAEAHANLGLACLRLKRYAAAVQAYDRALLGRPSDPQAHANRALALHHVGDWPQAQEAYEMALNLQPDWPLVLTNLGNLHRDRGQFEAAVDCYQKALMLAPHYGDAFFNLGVVMQELRHFEAALDCYDQALSGGLSVPKAMVFANRGLCRSALSQHELALQEFDIALGLTPHLALAHLNRGNALRALWRLEEARHSYERALAWQPRYAQAHANLGNVLRELKLFDAALSHYQAALAIKPDWHEVAFSQGLLHLLMGHFEAGWPLYEARKLRPSSAHHFRALASELWTGQQGLRGKSVFLHTEQGLGDTLQFVRYVPLLAQAGACVHLEVPASLRALLADLPGVSVWHDRGHAAQPETDFHCSLLSLPGAFQTKVGHGPAPGPYLRAAPERVAHWRKRLGAGGFKIGIAWQGSVGDIDRGRSFALRELALLAALPGVRLISLQKNAGIEQMAHLPCGMVVEDLGPDFDAGPEAFLDSAAVMACVDLVISSDTALCHLAGALNRPTWLALPHVPDWRWLLDRSDSPWYPKHRLFRQSRWNDWGSVFEEMAQALREIIAG